MKVAQLPIGYEKKALASGLSLRQDGRKSGPKTTILPGDPKDVAAASYQIIAARLTKAAALGTLSGLFNVIYRDLRGG